MIARDERRERGGRDRAAGPAVRAAAADGRGGARARAPRRLALLALAAVVGAWAIFALLRDRDAGAGAIARPEGARTVLVVALDRAPAELFDASLDAAADASADSSAGSSDGASAVPLAERAPHLAALGARGVAFADHVTSSSGLGGALATLLSGCAPRRHGVGDPARLGHRRLAADVPALAEALATDGWTSLAAVASPELDPALTDLARGFAEWRGPRLARGATTRTAGAVLDDALPPLAELCGTSPRVLALVQLVDLAAPERAPAADRARFLPAHLAPFAAEEPQVTAALAKHASDPEGALADLRAALARRGRTSPVAVALERAERDGALHALDRELGRLLDLLRDAGRLEDALVVVVGLRPPAVTPAARSSEDLPPPACRPRRTPLLFAGPAVATGRDGRAGEPREAAVRAGAAGTSTQLAELADVAPTVARLAAERALERADGRALLAAEPSTRRAPRVFQDVAVPSCPCAASATRLASLLPRSGGGARVPGDPRAYALAPAADAAGPPTLAEDPAATSPPFAELDAEAAALVRALVEHAEPVARTLLAVARADEAPAAPAWRVEWRALAGRVLDARAGAGADDESASAGPAVGAASGRGAGGVADTDEPGEAAGFAAPPEVLRTNVELVPLELGGGSLPTRAELRSLPRWAPAKLVVAPVRDAADEARVVLGDRALDRAAFPRVADRHGDPWPVLEGGAPAPFDVDVARERGNTLRVEVAGEGAVEALVATYPPRRPTERIAVAGGEGIAIEPVLGHPDLARVRGPAPLAFTVEKKATEDLALAVALDGRQVPLARMRYEGRTFSRPGELALYLPDWLPGASEALAVPPALAALPPGTLALWRPGAAPELVEVDLEQLEALRTLSR